MQVYDGIQVCYHDGKVYTGYIESIRSINGRTLVTIALPTKYGEDREYRSVYMDKCVSFDIIESVYN